MFREASNLLKVIQFVKALELELFQLSLEGKWKVVQFCWNLSLHH